MRKTVLITGASGGIGTACALAAARAGWNTVIHYHQNAAAAQELAEAVRGLGSDAVCVHADAKDSAQVNECVAASLRSFPNIDGLLCCAGAAQQKLLQDVTDEEWRSLLDANLSGTFYFIRALLPHMISRKTGAIVTMSSVWGVRGGSFEAVYSAAKAGVIGLTRALAQEVGPSGITVNCLAPGVIDTRMCACFSQETKRSLAEDTPLSRLGTPEDVAKAAVFLLEQPFITGQVLGVDGGF